MTKPDKTLPWRCNYGRRIGSVSGRGRLCVHTGRTLTGYSEVAMTTRRFVARYAGAFTRRDLANILSAMSGRYDLRSGYGAGWDDALVALATALGLDDTRPALTGLDADVRLLIEGAP